MSTTDSEWDRRILCSDGNCIGIIGSDGRCKECGRPYEGGVPLPVTTDDDGASEGAGSEAATDGDEVVFADTAATDEPERSVDAGEDHWENRTLCIDESCIGVVGADGRCGECGKLHPGKQP